MHCRWIHLIKVHIKRDINPNTKTIETLNFIFSSRINTFSLNEIFVWRSSPLFEKSRKMMQVSHYFPLVNIKRIMRWQHGQKDETRNRKWTFNIIQQFPIHLNSQRHFGLFKCYNENNDYLPKKLITSLFNLYLS